MRFRWLMTLMLGVSATDASWGEAPLTIARPAAADLIDFRRQVLPILQANCLPCHNRTTTKGELLLETPADMLKGGESGPALVAGNAVTSLLVRLSTHSEKPRMPPRDNKVNAVDLTPEQLGIIAQWIDQGAKEGERGTEKVRWLANNPEVHAIYAVAVTSDGQYAACGRGNRLFVYHRPTSQRVAELQDPALAENGRPTTAQRDMVGALAFRPDGAQLASAGFREVKLWRRVETSFVPLATNSVELGATNEVRSSDGSRLVRPGTNGVGELWDAENHRLAVLEKHAWVTTREGAARLEITAAKSEAGTVQRRVEAADKEAQQQVERRGKAQEAQAKARELAKEKQKTRDRSEAELKAAEAALSTPASDASADVLKGLTNRVEVAQKPAEEARRAYEEAARKLAVSDEEVRLAELGEQLSRDRSEHWQSLRFDLTNRVAQAERRERELAVSVTLTNSPLELAAISADARWVATISDGRRIALWSGSQGEPIETWESPTDVTGLGFGTNQTLQVRGPDGSYVRDLLPGWELQRVLGGENTPGPFADRVVALAYSPNGRWLASGSGEPSRSGDVQWWDPSLGTLAGAVTNLHSDTVLGLAFSPDSTVLASCGADRFARLIDLGRGISTRALEGHLGHVLAVAWKDDNATVATGGADLVVKFWDSVSGEKRKQATGFEREVTGLSFLTGDLWVASGSPRELRIINENGDRVRGLSGLKDAVYALAVSADGRWIVAGGEEGVLRIWDRDVEAPRLSFEGAPPALSATSR